MLGLGTLRIRRVRVYPLRLSPSSRHTSGILYAISCFLYWRGHHTILPHPTSCRHSIDRDHGSFAKRPQYGSTFISPM